MTLDRRTFLQIAAAGLGAAAIPLQIHAKAPQQNRQAPGYYRFDVGDFDGCAENHLAGVRNGRHIDDHRVLHAAFDVTDPRLDHTLLLTGSVVFGVFLQVTQLAGRTDVLAELRTDDFGQVSVLLFQGASALNGHWVLRYAHAFNPACRSCKRRTVFSGPNFSASQIASPAAMVVVQ